MSPAPVAIVRCDSYERAEVEDALARAVDLLGGAETLLPASPSLLLKPNFLYASRREKRVNTDPEVVRAAARIFGHRAQRLVFGDSPAVESARRVARTCGLTGALEGLDVEPVAFSSPVTVSGATVKSVPLAREALENGPVINLAKFKTHGMMRLTMAVKNLFGCVPGLRKSGMHLRAGEDRQAFADILVNVAMNVPASLHVLDAVVAMEGNGPGSGDPRPIGALLASPDPVALDRVACSLVGVPPEEIFLFEAAERAGFGEADLAKIEILGDDPKAFAVGDFKPADPESILGFLPLPRPVMRWVRRLWTPKPVVDARRCKACGACARACPADAIRFRPGEPPVIDRGRCVRCFCCQEICPEGAIRLRRGLR